MKRVSILVFALTCTGISGRAHADDRVMTASEIFRAGQAAYARGDYRAAALAFEAAFQRKAHGATSYNAGLAWESAGEQARAADAYALALQTPGLPESQAPDARARLGELDAKLARIEIEAPAGARVSVAHLERAAAPTTVRLLPGEYDVRAEYAGGETRTQHVSVVVAGQLGSVTFSALPVAPTPAPGPAAVDDPGGGRRTVGWIGVGAGAAIVGAGVVVNVVGRNAKSDYEDDTVPDPTKYDRAIGLRTSAFVLYGVGAAVAITGLVLVLTAPSASRPSAKASLVRTCPGACVRF